MPKTGPYDFLVAKKDDGYSKDIWDSDTEGGLKRIQEREVAANNPRPVTKAAVPYDHWAGYFAEHRKKSRDHINASMETVIEALGVKFREEKLRVKTHYEAFETDLRGQFAELSAEIREEILELKRARQALVEQEHASDEAARRLRLVASGRSK